MAPLWCMSMTTPRSAYSAVALQRRYRRYGSAFAFLRAWGGVLDYARLRGQSIRPLVTATVQPASSPKRKWMP